MDIARGRWTRILVHAAALAPLAVLAWDAAHGRLTVNPIREIQLRTGRYAMFMLAASLACTPANTVFRTMAFLPLRRTLGLYAFTYASLHFLNFIGLDYGFNLALLWPDISEKRYAIAGFATYLSLVPLAVTSTLVWAQRLGANWTRLHRLVYLAAALAVVHFLWQVKADTRVPLLYAAVLTILLLMRLPPVRRLLARP